VKKVELHILVDKMHFFKNKFNLKKVKDLMAMDIPRSLIGIPPMVRVKLRYADYTTHTHTSGALQNWTLRGNSVYDPDFTYTGHQPTGFDELAAFFMYYKVVASKVIVKASSLTSDIPQVVVIRPVRENVAPSDWENAVESTRSAFDFIPTNGIPMTTTENHASTAALYPGQNDDDQDFGADVGSNPTKVWYWRIDTQSSGASTAVLAINVIAEYDVIFSQKQVLGSS